MTIEFVLLASATATLAMAKLALIWADRRRVVARPVRRTQRGVRVLAGNAANCR